jgi:hypothetical protein
MSGLRTSVAFPTGNGVLRLGGSTADLLLDRDLRDSVGDRWYWHIELESGRDRTVRVCMARPGLLGRYGPAVSVGGSAYGWLCNRPDAGDEGFVLALPAGVPVRVCATLPYGPDELRRFQERTGDLLRWDVLTSSGAGRPVPVMRAGEDGTRLLLLTARHHACEATASYVLEGAVDRLLAMRSDSPEWSLLAVPAVDLDGVVRGDQGKGRLPRDHNRDYGAGSRFASVRALQRLIETERRSIVALDLHTPGLRGALEERCYVAGSPDPEDPELAAAVAAATDLPDVGTLIFDGEWNSAASHSRMGSSAWLRGRPNAISALTVEFPNAVFGQVPVTSGLARIAGARLLDGMFSVVYRSG